MLLVRAVRLVPCLKRRRKFQKEIIRVYGLMLSKIGLDSNMK